MAFGLNSPSPFSFPMQQQQQQQQPSILFSTPQQQLQQQQFLLQQQQQQQQIHLLTKEKTPVTYHTKWADLHPDSQNLLLQVEQRILEYRNEGRQLDQCERLFNSVALNEGFEVDAARISQELGQVATAMDREKISLQELMKTAKDMMRNAEVAVRSFMVLRTRFSHKVSQAVSSNPMLPVAPSAGMGPGQAAVPGMPFVDFYSGVPIKPSPFLQHTVHRFEQRLQEYKQWIEELERLLYAQSAEDDGKESGQMSLLQSLPTVMTNIHDFFIYVAAKVETLHQQIGSMRATYLAEQRKRGNDNNPFLEADRREVAKKEAAARRVHPTLQATSAMGLPMTQSAGLLTSATTTSALPSTSLTISSSPSFSVFGTSSSLSSSSSSIFGTPSMSAPTLSLFGSSSTPGSTLFGSTGQSTTPLGSGTSPASFPASGSSGSLFSSTFAGASGPSSFGGLFGSTSMASSGLLGLPSPSAGHFGGQSSGNIFGNPVQPFGSTNVLGGGAPAFGIGTTQATNTTKAKARTTRRK